MKLKMSNTESEVILLDTSFFSKTDLFKSLAPG